MQDVRVFFAELQGRVHLAYGDSYQQCEEGAEEITEHLRMNESSLSADFKVELSSQPRNH